MTLTQLKHILELAKTGTFIKSAENLFLTQPALSRSIKTLEDELGGKLFDRQGRQSIPTVFGEEILKRAQILLDSAKDLKEINQSFKKGLSGQIKIGMGSGPGAILMTPLLQNIAIQFPQLHLEVTRGTTEMLTDSLRSRALDALVIDARSIKLTQDLNLEIIYETPGAFMCRNDHPITKLRKITLGDLKKYPIASTPLSDEVQRILIDRYGMDANLETLVNIKCSEISSLVDVANTSDVILFAIRNAAPTLQELKITPALNASAKFGFVTVANRSESPLLFHIRKVIDSILKD
jgi:DNA-binding transcriptional LysR family regulator